MAALGGLARRAGWNVVDQALSALANLLLTIVVARAVDATAFGAFAIGFLVYGIAVAVAKAICGQPLQVRHSALDRAHFREAVAGAQGSACWLGVLGGVVCALVGWLLGGAVGQVLVAVAVCLPGLVVQDTYRMAFFAEGTPHRAALIDTVKIVVQFGGLFALLAAGIDDVGRLTLCWGLAATLSAVVGAVLMGAAPALGRARRWLADQRELTRYLLAEYTLGHGAAQFGSLLVPILGTTRDAGAIRGAQTLVGPLNVLGTAAFAFAVPEVSRRGRMGARVRLLAMGAVSGAMGAVSIVWVTILLLLPDPAGEQLFGDSWAGAQMVLFPMGLNAIASALGTGPGTMLIGMGLARKTFRLNLVKAPILLGLLVPGTLVAGALGAAWAMAISEIALLPFWVLTAWRAAHGRYAHLVVAPVASVEADGPAADGRTGAERASDLGRDVDADSHDPR